MGGFADQPIARKALTLGIVPALCALVLLTITTGIAVYLSLRNSVITDGEALSSIVANNLSAAVAFNDVNTATSLLESLKSKDSIDRACVYDAAGALFASYTITAGCPAHEVLTPNAAAGELRFPTAIAVGERRVGSLLLVLNQRLLYDRMRSLAMISALALLTTVALALLIAYRIQRSISEPVMRLAVAADSISKTRDYSMRVEAASGDEVGRLVTAFNAMLSEVQRQEKVKDEFLATLSHELRTPLNAMLGWLQILQKTEPDDSTKARAFASLERNARIQQRVIEDLLDISRIVTGKLQVSRHVTDLAVAVRSAVDVTLGSALQKKIDLSVSIPAAPCLVSGDATRLQQLLWNLLSNAVKFTPETGKVVVNLTEERSSYVIEVGDTGIGIAPEFLPYVFERFRQADSSTTRQHGGLGLGLAIVHEIAVQHGGSIHAASAGIGTGATFTLRIPRLIAEDDGVHEHAGVLPGIAATAGPSLAE